MTFTPEIAERRFGYGMSPKVAAPQSAADLLGELAGPDRAQAAYPLPPFRHVQDAIVLRRRFNSYARKRPDTAEGKAALEKSQEILRGIRRDNNKWFTQIMLRRITANQGFRERLVAFWADHFTAVGKNALLRPAVPLYVEEAVRPHVAGRFGDMLIACVTHPMMLHYLDQNTSAGPNSRIARRRPERRLGLNENLAREVLELHTLGVNAPYTQADVQELAKLLTGLSATRDYGFKFRPSLAEPGAETVLGRQYEAKGGLQTIRAVLQDIAVHPATARHIARKLVVHFIADTPPPSIVAAVEAAYRDSGGMLLPCYEALLAHPEAWQGPATNMRPPEEFVSAALRALAPPEEYLSGLKENELRQLFLRPLQLMGQPWMTPGGPDGFAEEDKAWVTPQGIAARLEWAMNTPVRLMADLPDPRIFVHHALGDDVPGAVSFAANAAESRDVAIGLILASPAFQRR